MKPVIGIGIAQAHFSSFGGNARAKATLCIAQGSSARFVETDSASTRSQPFISRPRISNGPHRAWREESLGLLLGAVDHQATFAADPHRHVPAVHQPNAAEHLV